MIDEEWLAGLRFEGPDGVRIDGLAGVGSEKVVLKAITPDGKLEALSTYRHHLGFYIKEIPLFLSAERPLYDVDRLNRKLLRLVGNPLLDMMTCEYDRLCCCLIKTLYDAGSTALLFGAAIYDFDSTDAVPFFLHTPGIQRRLRDWAALSVETENPMELILRVNGPNFPFTDMRKRIIDWSQSVLAAIENAPGGIRPSELPNNPLYVWGAAVMDGFFTDGEIPQAVAFVDTEFGQLRKHPKAVIYLQQANALADLLAGYLKTSEVGRFVQFCRLLGFSFDVHDRSGRIMSDEDLLRRSNTSEEGTSAQASVLK